MRSTYGFGKKRVNRVVATATATPTQIGQAPAATAPVDPYAARRAAFIASERAKRVALPHPDDHSEAEPPAGQSRLVAALRWLLV